MFGMNMIVSYDGFSVSLRPLSAADLPNLVKHFNSMKVHMYTMGLFAQTLENEEDWYNKNRTDPTSCLWAIVPEGTDSPVGITGLHNIDVNGSCTSGIIIWDTSWWGKGVATRSHLARTLFAADYLGRSTIKSAARIANKGSYRALLRLGYNKVGIEPRTFLRAGKYLDTQIFCWINPERVNILFPEGLPKKYEKGVLAAGKALSEARKTVSFP